MLWLIGAGYMAKEYVKVLKNKNIDFKVIARGAENAQKFKTETGEDAVLGGLKAFLSESEETAKYAIVATNVVSLFQNTKDLIEAGVKNILVEKPAFLSKAEGLELEKLAKSHDVKLFIAYNRRYFASTQKARDLLESDGGVASFNFEFTEWGHEIETLDKNKTELDRWILSNSSHVLDLAFFLGGAPVSMNTFKSGSLTWHKSGARFSGAGQTEQGSVFSYFADWGAPGRWSVEVLSNLNRYIFKPMEKLQVTPKGSVSVSLIEDVDYQLDIDFKPGLFLMVSDFLKGEKGSLCTISEQNEMFKWYNKISGYENNE